MRLGRPGAPPRNLRPHDDLGGSCGDEAFADDDTDGAARREGAMGERVGVALALLSSMLGGTAAAVTRYLVADADPVTLAILRWGIGFFCVLPAALLLRVKWPPRADWPAIAGLG